MRKRFLLPLIALCAATGFSCDSRDAAESSDGGRSWPRLSTLCKLDDPAIDESSGIAASPSEDGVYYTHNDSGDTARFFKFNEAGHVLATYSVSNAKKAIDWEDMASCKVDGKSYLFLGDIGDNAGVRKDITVYRVPEPTAGSGDVKADRIWTFTYPDEPHNAETLMVDPLSNDLYIVIKRAKNLSTIFKSKGQPGSGDYKLERVGELEVGGSIREGRLITAGDIAPDGKHVVLRTYLGAYEWDFTDKWWEKKPNQVQINLELQGEAICYSRDGLQLLSSTEGSPCQISRAILTK